MGFLVEISCLFGNHRWELIMYKMQVEIKNSSYPRYSVELFGCTICGSVKSKWNVSAGSKTLNSQVKHGS